MGEREAYTPWDTLIWEKGRHIHSCTPLYMGEREAYTPLYTPGYVGREAYTPCTPPGYVGRRHIHPVHTLRYTPLLYTLYTP